MKNCDHPPASIQPRKEPVQARSRARFERILTVTLELIVDKGGDAVSMSEIAEKAEISIASLYQYFPDKAAIIATLADRYNREGQHCIQGVFAKVLKPAHMIPAMHEMIDSYFEFFCQAPGGRAVWQASQSDIRLQAIDAKDIELHAKTIAAAFRKAVPDISSPQSLRLGRLFTGMVVSTVRAAIILNPCEARAMIETCKQVILTPAIKRALNLSRA